MIVLMKFQRLRGFAPAPGADVACPSRTLGVLRAKRGPWSAIFGAGGRYRGRAPA